MAYYPTWIIWLFYILTAGLAICSLYWYIYGRDGGFSFAGGADDNGLTRHFFFNVAPYKAILGITACIAISFIAVVLIMIAVGGLAWVLLWLVKIICYIVFWLGCIMLGLGVLALLCRAKEGLYFAIPGGLIVIWGNPIKHFAEMCVEWGETIWATFNVFYFAKDIVLSYWEIGLSIVFTPLTIFLSIALIWMAFALCLRFYDWVTTRYYSVHHPCPYCQENSEPAIYHSKGVPLHTELKPGVYGLFHITHPETGEPMPTLLLNGRSRLARQCCRCGALIDTETGVDKHIAMVGGPESGKSALSLTMLGLLKASCQGFVVGNDVNLESQAIIEKISKEGRIMNNEFPNKTAEGVVPSLRANITREGKPPYALYINDIAGELFQPGKGVNDELKFLYNTTSLVFLVDPTTAFLRNPGPKMKKWLESHKNIMNPTSDIEEVYGSVRTYINELNRLSKMTINYVLVKTDTGYLCDINAKDPVALKQFIVDELGLAGIFSTGEFVQECFFAVSTIIKKGNVDTLNSELLKQQKIVLG